MILFALVCVFVFSLCPGADVKHLLDTKRWVAEPSRGNPLSQ